MVKDNSNNKNSFKILSVIGGLFIGLVNGFFGGGGGMLAVPLMTFILSVEEKKAHATAIYIILPLSIASSIFYITSGVIEYDTLIYVAIGVFIGGIIGAICLNKIQNKVINFVFAILMIVAGVRLMF